MGKALYRKYRSRSLDEIVGQSHITALLKRAIAHDSIAHAYLLTGPRGVGKTSIARILAHEINELPYTDESTHLDIIEIDAASNNSVEDIRDLREKVMIAPGLAKKKIYIIDEVHMLSKSAFNALLKTLEEPPEHVVFILATTDAEKLPSTIISRVQRFNFRTISAADVAAHLRTIADAERILIDDDALSLIAHHGGGSFRDSIGLLDQLSNLTDELITTPLVEQVVGRADSETIDQLLQAYRGGDVARIVELLDEVEARGTPTLLLTEQLIQRVRGNIASSPALLPLLDALLDVGKSAWPHIKLLTALATNQQVVLPPVEKITPKAPTAQPSVPAKVTTQPPKSKEKPVTPPLGTAQVFPWNEFLQHCKTLSAGVYSILIKTDHTFANNTLTIFAGKPFTKKQVEKSLSQLHESLEKVGFSEVKISILATSAPPSNSQVATALDIMGGGEEVKV